MATPTSDDVLQGTLDMLVLKALQLGSMHGWGITERLRDGSLVVEGTLSADVLRLGHHVPIPESAEFETVAGFMLDTLGSVARGGEVVSVGDYRLTVVDVEKNRISKVKIEKPPAPGTIGPRREKAEKTEKTEKAETRRQA